MLYFSAEMMPSAGVSLVSYHTAVFMMIFGQQQWANSPSISNTATANKNMHLQHLPKIACFEVWTLIFDIYKVMAVKLSVNLPCNLLVRFMIHCNHCVFHFEYLCCLYCSYHLFKEIMCCHAAMMIFTGCSRNLESETYFVKMLVSGPIS